jgi:hypothetical protein
VDVEVEDGEELEAGEDVDPEDDPEDDAEDDDEPSLFALELSFVASLVLAAADSPFAPDRLSVR